MKNINVQSIRAAAPEDRFRILASELCGRDADEIDAAQIMEIEHALHRFKTFRFVIDSVHSLVLSQEDSMSYAPRKVIAENSAGVVIKKETPHGYIAYDFLQDYLGLGGFTPSSTEELCARYPNLRCIQSDSILAYTAWFEIVTKNLLKELCTYI